MCFDISYALKREEIEKRFDAEFEKPDLYEPAYHVSAFSLPNAPIITNERAQTIQMLKWGLIPFWVKDEKSAEEIRMRTFNARAETVFEKASFKSSIRNKRCLVIVGGFYEWRLVKGKNYPYHIQFKDENAFGMAGIWDSWKNKETGEKLDTFSIITTKANPLLEKIHNKKKRMPVILKKEDERTWLEEDLGADEIKSLLEPIEDTGLKAYTVSRLISFKKENSNVPEVMKRHEYEELKSEQTKLF